MPVIIEIPKTGRNVNRTYLHRTESGMCEQFGKRFRRAERKPVPLVEIKSRRIERHSRIPEVAHQLHLSGVVPDVGGHGAPRPDRTSHLRDGAGRLGHEIENQPSDGHVKAPGIDW